MTILTVALGSALVVGSISKGFVLKELPPTAEHDLPYVNNGDSGA